MPQFCRDGVELSYAERGEGDVFLYQHGLGGDASQPLSQAPPGRRVVALENRGHGDSGMGPVDGLRFDTYADDLAMLMDRLGLNSAPVGGISMGAGVALALAVRQPERVLALVLVRPAWLDHPNPEHLAVFADIADLLRRHEELDAERIFAAEHLPALRGRGLTPAGERSLLSQFRRPRARECSAVLERMPISCPVANLAILEGLEIPTLILFTQADFIHPARTAEVLAGRLPAARLCEVPSRDGGDELHRKAITEAIGGFLDDIDKRKEVAA